MHGSTASQRIAWIERHCPLTQAALARLPRSLPGKLAVRFHLDLKMVPLLLELHRRRRDSREDDPGLLVLACNDDTIDPQAWRLLLERGVDCRSAATDPLGALGTAPTEPLYLCDLGGEMISAAHAGGVPIAGAMEGTTTGLSLLRDAGLAHPEFPLLDWNDNLLKVALHNEKMVGFSIWQTFHEVTRLSLHALTVAVLGFGGVGRGIARSARGHGAEVLIYDPDPELRHLARCEGFSAPELRGETLNRAGVIVSATGREDALAREDLAALRSGVFILNAGHSAGELCRELRCDLPRCPALAQVEEVQLDDRRYAFVLSGGQVFNLSAGFGDSINGFDVTLANLVESLSYLFEVARAPDGPRGWLTLPRARSRQIWTTANPSGSVPEGPAVR